MDLVGPDGRPLSLPLSDRVKALESNLQITFGLVQQLKDELVNQALKVHFLINELSTKKVLDEELDEKYQAFVRQEMMKMQGLSEENHNDVEL